MLRVLPRTLAGNTRVRVEDLALPYRVSSFRGVSVASVCTNVVSLSWHSLRVKYEDRCCHIDCHNVFGFSLRAAPALDRSSGIARCAAIIRFVGIPSADTVFGLVQLCTRVMDPTALPNSFWCCRAFLCVRKKVNVAFLSRPFLIS